MAFENRLREKLPTTDSNPDTDEILEKALEDGNLTESDLYDELVDKHEFTGYAMTSDTFDYSNLQGVDVDVMCKFRIDTEPIAPTQKDYEKGWFVRYFIKRYDDLPIEVNKKEFLKLRESTAKAKGLYQTRAMKWYLSPQKIDLNPNTANATLLSRIQSAEVGELNADIEKINKRYTLKTDKELPGITRYINGDYKRFTIEGDGSVESNLYTSGREYKRPNGDEYIG